MNNSLDINFGIHSCFNYYGEEHLLVNLAVLIIAGLENRETVYLSMEDHLFKRVLKTMDRHGAACERIKAFPISELVVSYKTGGYLALKAQLDSLVQEALASGQSGICLICQVAHAIKETSRMDYLEMENNLTDAIQNTRISFTCVYDFYDFINEKKIIDDHTVKSAGHSHTHRFHQFKHLKIES